MHVVGKKKTLGQGLSNATTLAFLLHPHIGGRRQRLAVQQKLRLPCWCGLGGGRNALPDLGLWLVNDDTSCWPGRSLDGYVSQTRRRLIGNPLFFPSPSNMRRGWKGRHLASTLRWWGLGGLPCTGHETIDGHDPPSHHVFAEMGIYSQQVGRFRHKMLGLCNKVLGLSLLLNKGLFLNSLVS